MKRALIVLLDDGVTERGAEQILSEIEHEFRGDVVWVEHFTKERAYWLIGEGYNKQ